MWEIIGGIAALVGIIVGAVRLVRWLRGRKPPPPSAPSQQAVQVILQANVINVIDNQGKEQ